MNSVRKELKPFILKAGFALFAGIFAGIFAARRLHHRRTISPPPPLHHISDLELEHGSSTAVVDIELPMHQTEEALTKISPLAPVTLEEDEEEFTEFLPPASPLTDCLEIKDSLVMEEEIKNLKNLVKSLQEREICLEMKLLEYHGLKEQEVLMGELHNRLKISSTETKLLSLKIESLKAENEKLRSEASEYSRVVSELEIQRKNVAILESKLKSVGEQAKEKIGVLHGRIIELREKEKKELEDFVEVEKNLSLFSKVRNDVIEIGKEDSRLEQEKSVIVKKLEFQHILNPSVLRSPDSVLKIQELGTLEEQNQLREENENLKKKLEQLQVDRCEDVEELVYLRWINACLRYELRNYQPPTGRTVARDLSNFLSPKSEQKAKQLILDYSSSHSTSNRMDFDLDDCFSQTSSEEFDDNSLDSSKTKSSKSSKSKLVNKLKKLVLPKNRNEDKMVMRTGSDLNSSAIDDCRRKSFGSTSGLSEEKKTNNTIGVEFHGDEKWQIKRNHSHDLPYTSLNGRVSERCYSDIGVVYAHKRMLSLDDNSTYNSSARCEEGEDHEKEKLKKFAQVFKDSLGSLKSKRLPSSLSIG